MSVFITVYIVMYFLVGMWQKSVHSSGKERRVMPANIRKKKPDVKVAYITLVRACGMS